MRLASLSFFVSILALLSFQDGAAQTAPDAEPYRLGVGDVLRLSVWQQPGLDRDLPVREDGTIVVPLAGEIAAAGKTVTELEEELARMLRAFNRDIAEVSLTVVEYKSLRVFVMGAVSNPGEYAFDHQPNVWDAVRAAGGPRPEANLRRVRVLRRNSEGAGSSIQVVDLFDVVRGLATDEALPTLQAGDTVLLPDTTTLTAGLEDGVQVEGAISKPGLYLLDEPSPLMTVVLQAGGFANNADLSRVRWVRRLGEGTSEARKVDVSQFLKNGQAGGNPLIRPGDTIYVERSNPARGLLSSGPRLLATAAAVAAVIVRIARP